MNDSTIAFRAKERIPLGEAEPTGVLSSIMRAINDDPDMRHAVEKRLSRNVANEDIGPEIDKAILEEGAKHVREDSLILVDPTEIQNDKVLKLITTIMGATGGKGILVYDRGGDRPAFYRAFMEDGWDFIVRMTGRNVLSWNDLHEIHWLAQQCTMRHHHHVEFDSHGRECSVQISFAETRQGPRVRELRDRGRPQTCLYAVREMVPQDHRLETRANRE